MSSKKPVKVIKLKNIKGDPMKGWALNSARYIRDSKIVPGQYNIFQRSGVCNLYFMRNGAKDAYRHLLGTFSDLNRAKLEVLYFEGEPEALKEALKA